MDCTVCCEDVETHTNTASAIVRFLCNTAAAVAASCKVQMLAWDICLVRSLIAAATNDLTITNVACERLDFSAGCGCCRCDAQKTDNHRSRVCVNCVHCILSSSHHPYLVPQTWNTENKILIGQQWSDACVEEKKDKALTWQFGIVRPVLYCWHCCEIYLK